MKIYLITFLYGTYGDLLYGCTTYVSDCFRDAKSQFHAEYQCENCYIKQVDVLGNI